MLLIELYVIVHNLDTQSLGSWGSLGRIWAGCGHILWAAGTLREHMEIYKHPGKYMGYLGQARVWT